MIYQKAPPVQPPAPQKNLIIQWEGTQARVVKEFRNLGIIKADPNTYVQQYGTQLRPTQGLPDFIKGLPTPNLGPEYVRRSCAMLPVKHASSRHRSIMITSIRHYWQVLRMQPVPTKTSLVKVYLPVPPTVHCPAVVKLASCRTTCSTQRTAVYPAKAPANNRVTSPISKRPTQTSVLLKINNTLVNSSKVSRAIVLCKMSNIKQCLSTVLVVNGRNIDAIKYDRGRLLFFFFFASSHAAESFLLLFFFILLSSLNHCVSPCSHNAKHVVIYNLFIGHRRFVRTIKLLCLVLICFYCSNVGAYKEKGVRRDEKRIYVCVDIRTYVRRGIRPTITGKIRQRRTRKESLSDRTHDLASQIFHNTL